MEIGMVETMLLNDFRATDEYVYDMNDEQSYAFEGLDCLLAALRLTEGIFAEQWIWVLVTEQ
jgi:hypothetical protein